MTDGPVIEAEVFRELVGVARPRPQELDDPRAVRTAAGAGDQEPEQLAQGGTHGRRHAVAARRI